MTLVDRHQKLFLAFCRHGITKRMSAFGVVCCVLFFTILLAPSSTVVAQCGYGGVYMGDVTPAGVGQTVELLNWVWGGEQYSLATTEGCTYTVSTCSGGFDSQITVFDETLTSVAYNDDFCGLQSQVTFTAATTGTYTIQINEYFCASGVTALTYFGVTLDSCAAGCGDVSACNYAAGSSGNDGCCYDNCLLMTMNDIFGDGWNGSTYMIADESGSTVASGTLAAGSFQVDDLCLPDGCYVLTIGGGAFDSEISWSLSGTSAGTLSGGSPTTVMFDINGSPDCVIDVPTPLIVDGTTYAPANLISDVFLGDCLDATGITYTGAAGAVGVFSNGGGIGIEEGIILTTGDLYNAPGPNNIGSSGTSNLGAGDPLLDALAGSTTYDAAVFTFDFTASTSQVTFTYVFASEEYPEFVCSTFNDAFGFFVTGPGYAANTNIAAVPGTADLVSINNVNDNGAACPPYYSQYYNDNTSGQVIQFDGYTDPMEAVINTVPCETYQIKIAVADAGDGIYDSAVFLQAESFTAGVDVGVTAIDLSGSQSSSADCGPGGSFILANDGNEFTEPITLTYSIGGTAVEGVDYLGLPGSVTFQPGEDFVTIDVAGILAGLTNAPETVTLTLDGTCSCLPPPQIDLFLCLPIMLSVDWLDFQTRWNNNQQVAICDWSTASEDQNAYFTVERSIDRILWEEVGLVPAVGTAIETSEYTFEDKSPLWGTSYYRIKQTDINGDFSYSEVRALERYRTGEISVFPNPNKGSFQIPGVFAHELTILDSRGREVSFTSNTIGEFSLEHVAPGQYFVQVIRGEQVSRTRIIVN